VAGPSCRVATDGHTGSNSDGTPVRCEAVNFFPILYLSEDL